MSKQEKISAPIEQIPFADLYVSDLNPRSVFSPEGIEALAENIRQLGLIQNLAGLRDETGKVGIVAGGRRLRALELLQDDPRFATVSVKIAPDQATAKIWASSENHHREQPHPADEIREYGEMADRGVPVASIAVAFGVTEQQVYRRLKLASLHPKVLDALKAGVLTLGQAASFTVSEDEARLLEVLELTCNQNYSEHRIKQMLKSDSIRNTERKAVFVGQEAYEAEGGRITTDLFADTVFFDDPAILDQAFEAKLKAKAEAMKAQGWKWVEPVEDQRLDFWNIEKGYAGRVYREEGTLTEEQSERYDELSELEEGDVLDTAGQEELAALQEIIDGDYSDDQRAVGGVLMYVDYHGELNAYAGMIKKEDKDEAISKGVLEASKHPTAEIEKSPISQKLRDDLSNVARGARQHAVLRDPDLLIDLLAYQLSHNLTWKQPLGLSLNEVPNLPSTEAAGYALDERLTSNPPRAMWDVKDFGASFRAFRKKGADHIRGELVRFLAAQYQGGDATLKAMIDKETQPSIRDVWTPTAANFFSRVGGPYLNDLWCDLLGLDENEHAATSFAKLKKGEKCDKLEALFAGDDDLKAALGVTDEQAANIDAWLPEGMN